MDGLRGLLGSQALTGACRGSVESAATSDPSIKWDVIAWEKNLPEVNLFLADYANGTPDEDPRLVWVCEFPNVTQGPRGPATESSFLVAVIVNLRCRATCAGGRREP